MISEYTALKALQETHGYKILEALWIHQVSEMEKARDKAAKRGGDSAWRYWAGQEMGFKLAMTAVARALAEMEKQNENLDGEAKINRMLEEIRK